MNKSISGAFALTVAASWSCGGMEEVTASTDSQTATVSTARLLAGAPADGPAALAALGSVDKLVPIMTAVAKPVFHAMPDGSWDPAYAPCVTESPAGAKYTCITTEGTIDGTIAYQGGQIATSSLVVKTFFNEVYLNFYDIATVSLSATAAKGQVRQRLDNTICYECQAAAELVSDFDIDVGFTDGCPTSGQIHLEAHSHTYMTGDDVTIEARFGPACGDVKFYH